MNVELYLTVVASLVTYKGINTLISYVQYRRTKSQMNLLFDEIEQTIRDIKSESKEEPRRTRRSPLKSVNN